MDGPQLAAIGPDLAKALVALQSEVDPIKPNALNSFLHHKYVDLLGVIREVKPKLKAHGLAVIQLPSHIDGKSALRTIVIHESGQSVEDTMPILLPSAHSEEKWDKDAGKNVARLVEPDTQDQGAAITYLRRYAYMAALGLVTDDGEVQLPQNDARNAMGLRNPPKASTTKPPSGSQLSMIRRLAGERGLDPDATEERIKTLTSAADASEAITALKSMPRGAE